MIALRAGVAYAAIVFAIGFALGTIRVLVAAPRLGETGAVLLELPVMLTLSWFACAWLIRRFSVPSAATARLAMGVIALALLMFAELGVSVFGFGRSVSEHFATYRAAGAQLGFAAQIAFALIPLVQLYRQKAA